MAEGIVIGGKNYTAENTNEYQRIILEMIQHERGDYNRPRSSGATTGQLQKQLGVMDHYCEMLQDFDGIEAVQHIFEPILAKG